MVRFVLCVGSNAGMRTDQITYLNTETMNRIKIIALLLVSLLALGSCSDDNERRWAHKPNDQVKPISAHNKVIYEINVYAYSAEANFKGLEKDLPRLKELGVDILWLMPIHPIGEENRSGTLGSPYAVRDYKGLNPDYGTEEDFRSLVNAIHALDMEIWLDWVANHTAWDNWWVDEHLDYYAEKDGQRPYSPPGWNDAIQLDHSNPQLLDAMAEAMIYWISEFGVDGFRCDAADFVPLDFWRGLRAKVDAVKKVTWMSEGSDPAYMEVFDYDYAWGFAEALKKFGEDNDVAQLVKESKDLFSNPAYKDKGRMVYITNHDLNAYEGSEFRRYGDNVLPLTVLSYTIYDMPLIYNGQEIGMDKSMNFAEISPVEWNPTNKVFVDLHKKLTQLKRTQPALEDGTNRGELKIYPTEDKNTFAYSRIRGSNEVLVILNLGDAPARARFTGEVPEGEFKDYLHNTYKEFAAEGIPMHGNGYAVYVK